MKILFLTIAARIREISARSVYKDLIRKFRDEGHDIFVATPSERRFKEKAGILNSDGITILIIKTLNITQVNRVEKGIATFLIESQFKNAIKKHFKDIHFDLVLYSTPPVTFAKVIKYVKDRDNALSYLLLKDIFPQNAVDLGMIRKDSLIYRYFRRKEEELYKVSDFIGCMSQANVEYIRKHNPKIKPGVVEVNSNSIDPVEIIIDREQKFSLREKYSIPGKSTVFVYGGSFGKPQGIDFCIQVLDSQKNNKDIFFVFIGAGTEYARLKSWFDAVKPRNARLFSQLPRNEYDTLLRSCDAGLIFLDKHFTIPNFPSRLLDYLECKIPVIAATDRNTDLGRIIEENSFGFWSEAGDLPGINHNIKRLSEDPVLCQKMGQNGYDFLIKNYTVSTSYLTIFKHFSHI